MPQMKILSTLIKHCSQSKAFNRIAGSCKPISASEGKVRVEFEVSEDMTNPVGTLHGGCTATLVDIATTAACLTTKPGLPGVTVDLHVTYLAAAKLGETVVLDAEVVKAGKRVAFTKADLFLKSNNRLVATGLHTKMF